MSDSHRPFMPPDPKGEFLFDVPLYLVNLLVAVARVREADTDRLLRPFGLSETRFRTLVGLWRLTPCSMSELATITASDRTSLTRTVDQLVAAGLMERSDAVGDRRKVQLSITRKGRQVVREASVAVMAYDNGSLAGMDEDVQRTMVRGLEIMLKNLGATDEMVKVLAPRYPDETW